MAKRLKLNIGDIFTIPLSEKEVGFGQIVQMPDKYTLIIVVYNYKTFQAEKYDIEKAVDSEILFLGYTNDAKLYHKDWKIVGNLLNNISRILLPCFKLGLPSADYPDGARLVDFKGNVLANIDKKTFDKLHFQTEVGPIRFENALKAHFNLHEWIAEDYDKILYQKTLESVEIAAEILNN
ncbi:Imm26 family immunity protein [Chryseobacterium populi]|uniref:Immunity protein 26 n=1 Tax=Chryseobacterium populi TaxID=1144316 RepID=J2T8H4_9FLAO|nr:Imm26 family immunity protein [Chryseobacterium populi]EJL74397.1 hypothetical protein PMI13_01136 [Chryseobacterium populi]